MSSVPASDDLLIDYLVGASTRDDEERFDELSIADDDFAARLIAVENDLVDAYVNGELSDERLTRFRAHYLRSRAGLEKVRFAEALRRNPRAVAVYQTRFLDWRLAAAAAVLLAVVGYFAVQNARLRNEVAELRANPVSAAQPPRTQSAPAREPVIAAFLLMPATRGLASLPTLTISRGTDAVAIVLAETEDFPAYDASLKELTSDQIVWRRSNLAIVPGGTARSVLVTIPAASLKDGNYAIELTGVPRNGNPEVINSYPFQVMRAN